MICLVKDLAGISSALSMQINCAIQPQSNRKRTTAIENQPHQGKEIQTLFCERIKDGKCSAGNKNIRKLFAWIVSTNGLKALFSSFPNALKL